MNSQTVESAYNSADIAFSGIEKLANEQVKIEQLHSIATSLAFLALHSEAGQRERLHAAFSLPANSPVKPPIEEPLTDQEALEETFNRR